MVDSGVEPDGSRSGARHGPGLAQMASHGSGGQRRWVIGRRWFTTVVVGALAASSLVLALGTAGARSASASPPLTSEKPVSHRLLPGDSRRRTTAIVAASPISTTVQAPPPTSVAPAQTPPPSNLPPASSVSITSLVAQVEAAGVEPGPNWSWSVGDTSAQCGVIAGTGAATGCTSWAAGAEHTVFAGSASLALVAHELANAETERDAVPSLLDQVAAAAAGTSWSPTDAVASCLVEHFLGFQDQAAGTWRCPVALAAFVAEHIHDTVVTTTTTATCGTKSGISSNLTFTATAGTLTVTTPTNDGPPMTVTAGTPVTVSGIGVFTAVDQGGTVGETGPCEG